MTNAECPQCRRSFETRRVLRPDRNLDALIAVFFPDIEAFEASELLASQAARSAAQPVLHSIEEGMKFQEMAAARGGAVAANPRVEKKVKKPTLELLRKRAADRALAEASKKAKQETVARFVLRRQARNRAQGAAIPFTKEHFCTECVFFVHRHFARNGLPHARDAQSQGDRAAAQALHCQSLPRRATLGV